MAASSGGRPTAIEIHRAIKETTASHEMFLCNLHIKPAKVKEIKNSSTDTDWALVQGIEFFLQNHCENQEWEMVANALQESKDSKTAEDIRRKHGINSNTLKQTSHQPATNLGVRQLHETDYYYCSFEKYPKQNIPHYAEETLSETICDEHSEHIENLKMKTVTEYNNTIAKVEKIYKTYEEALTIEYMEAKRVLDEHKSKIELFGDQLERDIKDLLEKIDETQQSLLEVPSKLKVGDPTAFAVITRVQDEMIGIESSAGNLEKRVHKFERKIPSSTNAPSTSEYVMQKLQDLIKINFKTSTEKSSEVDDSMYY